jgi:ribosome-associated protein
MNKFSIHTEYIELIGLLKATGIAMTGGEAKQMVDDNLVKLNGVIEKRRRAKIRPGDQVEINGEVINVVQE